MRRVLPLALLLLAVAAVAWWASRPPAVPALQVQTGPLVRSLQFSARVAAQSSVDVGATLTGRVATVAVREGDDVAAGTPLLRLEDDEARAALAQAEAQLAQARAAREGAGGSRLRAAEAQLAQAEAQRVDEEQSAGALGAIDQINQILAIDSAAQTGQAQAGQAGA